MAITSKFDAIYKRHAPDVPVAYLQALADAESNNNPKARSAVAVGLLQVSQGALDDYNKAKGKNRVMADLVDPVLNVKVFYVDWKMYNRVFQRIVRDLGTRRAANFIEDWSNPEYAKLVTAAWNSGIGAVAEGVKLAKPRLLEPVARSLTPMTAADVFTAGRKSSKKKVRNVLSVAKQAWQAKVVGAYFGLVKGEKAGLRVPTTVSMPGSGLFLLGVLWLLTRKGRRR